MFDNARCFRCRQLVFGLSLKLWLTDEHRNQGSRGSHHIFGGDNRCLFITHALAIGFQPFGQSGAQALFMRAAFRRRHGVAIAGRHAVSIANACANPANRPFDTAVTALFFNLAGKGRGRDRGAPANQLLKIVFQPIGKAQRVAGRCFFAILDERRVTLPANFHTAKQIGFGLCHIVEPRRVKQVFVAENLAIRHKADRCAAPVFCRAGFLQLALRQAARKMLLKCLLVARHLNQQFRRQRIDNRHANAMQPAGSVISLAAKLTACVQCRHNDFQRRFVLIFRVRVNRYAAAIIAHGQPVVGRQCHFNKTGMTGDRLIH